MKIKTLAIAGLTGLMLSACAQKDMMGSANAPLKMHKVVEGESLLLIAKKEYKCPEAWKYIYKANMDKIKNPNLIYPNQMLKLPAMMQKDYSKDMSMAYRTMMDESKKDKYPENQWAFN